MTCRSLSLPLYFSIRDDRDMEIKQAVLQVYRALGRRATTPSISLSATFCQRDPTYITTYKNARAIIRRIDRDDLLQALVRDSCEALKIRILKKLPRTLDTRGDFYLGLQVQAAWQSPPS